MNFGIVPVIGFAIAVGSNQHLHETVDEDMNPAPPDPFRILR